MSELLQVPESTIRRSSLTYSHSQRLLLALASERARQAFSSSSDGAVHQVAVRAASAGSLGEDAGKPGKTGGAVAGVPRAPRPRSATPKGEKPEIRKTKKSNGAAAARQSSSERVALRGAAKSTSQASTCQTRLPSTPSRKPPAPRPSKGIGFTAGSQAGSQKQLETTGSQSVAMGMSGHRTSSESQHPCVEGTARPASDTPGATVPASAPSKKPQLSRADVRQMRIQQLLRCMGPSLEGPCAVPRLGAPCDHRGERSPSPSLSGRRSRSLMDLVVGVEPQSDPSCSESQQGKLLSTVATEKHRDICSICLEMPQPGELLTGLPCCHWFHQDCVQEWLSYSNVCPLCKREATQSTS